MTTTYICAYCRKPFVPSSDQLRAASKGKDVYCSHACIMRHVNQRRGFLPDVSVEWECNQCGKTFELNHVQKWKRRTKGITEFYCSRSCRSRKVSSSEAFKVAIRRSNAERIDELRGQMAEMQQKAKSPEARAKMAATLRAKGHKPAVQGGNGRGLTQAQSVLLEALCQADNSHNWEPELSIKTGLNHGSGYPRNYKVDIGCRDLMLAIECDGSSHNSLKNKERDAKKDALLQGMGWTVVRYPNAVILADVQACVQVILALIPAGEQQE